MFTCSVSEKDLACIQRSRCGVQSGGQCQLTTESSLEDGPLGRPGVIILIVLIDGGDPHTVGDTLP